MKFEDKLMTLRKSKGWSQEDLANQIGVSRQTISKWESSQTTPEMNKLRELSKIFEISVDELINDENQGEKEEENFNENVFTKINLKSTNILLIIASVLLVIGLIVGIILYRKSKEFNDKFVEDIIIITYILKMNDNVEVTEIYSFNLNGECVGCNYHIKTYNEDDYNQFIKEITETRDKENTRYNIDLKHNEISWSDKVYIEEIKSKILKSKESALSNVQNLQIIDM